MKIAVCVSGHFRDYKEKLPTLFSNVLEGHDYDVYIHSWDNLGYSAQHLPDVYLTDGIIVRSPPIDKQDILNMLKPRNYVFEKFADVERKIKRDLHLYTNKNSYDNL